MDDTSGPGDEDGHAYSRQHIALGGRHHRRGRRDPRHRPRGRAGVLLALRAAHPALARARRQRPPRGAGGRGHAGGRPRPDRLRLRPHGGHLRPRHRGRRDGGATRAAHGPGPHRRDRRASSSRAWSTWCSSARARPAASSRRGRPGRARRPARPCAAPAAAPTCAWPRPPCAVRTECGTRHVPRTQRRSAGGARAARGRGRDARPGGSSSSSGRPVWGSRRPRAAPRTW